MPKGISILIVEDEPIPRGYTAELLRKRGQKVRVAGSEAEAMNIIDRGFIPESALIDVSIPEGRITRNIDPEIYGLTGGLRLARFVKNESSRCRIILNTGWGNLQIAQGTGVWGLHVKPSDFDILNDILCEGFLKDNELDKPVVDVNHEIYQRSLGKER